MPYRDSGRTLIGKPEFCTRKRDTKYMPRKKDIQGGCSRRGDMQSLFGPAASPVGSDHRGTSSFPMTLTIDPPLLMSARTLDGGKVSFPVRFTVLVPLRNTPSRPLPVLHRKSGISPVRPSCAFSLKKQVRMVQHQGGRESRLPRRKYPITGVSKGVLNQDQRCPI